MGAELVRVEALIVALLLLPLACRDSDPADDGERPRTMKGTVVTVRTTTDDGRSLEHQIVAADGLIRSLHELDRWTLIDSARQRVVTVDEISESWREQSLEELRQRKQTLASGSIPEHFPPATLHRSGRTAVIAGRPADEYVITAGGFRRELWMSRQPILSPLYMALRFGADEPGGPLPAALARIQLELMALEGVPLRDATSLKVGNETWGSVREVVGIAEEAIPAERFHIPEDFADAGDPSSLPSVRPSFRVPDSPR